MLEDFNQYLKLWRGFEVSMAYIKILEKLLLIILRRKIKQMIPVEVVIYKKFLEQSLVDLIFVTLLFLENFIY